MVWQFMFNPQAVMLKICPQGLRLQLKSVVLYLQRPGEAQPVRSLLNVEQLYWTVGNTWAELSPKNNTAETTRVSAARILRMV
jgi:hypothetical protein